MHRILVTGAATWGGGGLIQSLESRPGLEIAGVDVLEPQVEFRSPLHRIEIDTKEFVSLVMELEPEIVVHLQTLDRSDILGSLRAHEEAVVGAQTLFGAAARCPATEHVVLQSDAAVYGAGPRNPSVYTEDTPPHGNLTRHARDLAEMERGASEMQRANPEMSCTTLRFAPIFGADIGNIFSRYLRLKLVPTRLGFDPLLQLVHQQDMIRALEHAVFNRMRGIFNIAAPGQLYLNRIVRIGGRLRQPLPRRPFAAALSALARTDRLHVPPHLANALRYGLVMDTTRMRDVLDFEPRYSARQTVLAGYGLIASGRPG